jgi:hypothetical protein
MGPSEVSMMQETVFCENEFRNRRFSEIRMNICFIYWISKPVNLQNVEIASQIYFNFGFK